MRRSATCRRPLKREEPMRISRTWRAVALGLTIAATAAIPLGIAQDKAAAIKDRQALMKQQGEDLKTIVGFIKGESDQAAALTAVNDLLDKSQKIPDLFLPGTSMTEFPDATEAKPELWQNLDEFKGYIVKLHEEETKLVDAINAGKGPTAQQVAVVGRTACGNCHTAFRQKKS
jgi:cytochrome c556